MQECRIHFYSLRDLAFSIALRSTGLEALMRILSYHDEQRRWLPLTITMATLDVLSPSSSFDVLYKGLLGSNSFLFLFFPFTLLLPSFR